jgi:hypothetical protein
MGGRRHRQNHGETGGGMPSEKRKSIPPGTTNGGSRNGTTSPKVEKMDVDMTSPTRSIMTTGTPDLDAIPSPAAKGTVVSTGAIIPTAELDA